MVKIKTKIKYPIKTTPHMKKITRKIYARIACWFHEIYRCTNFRKTHVIV